MQLQLLQENINKAVGLVSRFTAQQSQLPVLSHIGLQAEAKELHLVATDMQLGIRLRVAAKLIKEGSIAIPGKVFSELIKSLPVGPIDITVNETMILDVVGGKIQAKLQGMSLQDFPMVNSPEGESWLSLSVEHLKQLVDRVSFALSTDDSRPILTGIYWNLLTGRIAATDGFRLSVVDGVMSVVKREDVEVLVVSGKLFQEAVKVLMELGEKEVRIFYDEVRRQLLFQGEEVILFGRVLQGEYPKFEAIMPQKIRMTIESDVSLLLQAVRSAAIFARDNAHIIELEIEGNQLKIMARAQQVGENQALVDIDNPSQGMGKVAFNSKYLLDILQQIKGERVRISLQGDLEAVLFEDINDETYKHVIMPMRLNQS